MNPFNLPARVNCPNDAVRPMIARLIDKKKQQIFSNLPSPGYNGV